ncbi:M16 family metallopeptidase [Melioribacteraceae bacterium 4301-Me]|uniref:M16 family metallopeptidase n=1 Tax=Pyranulibacter aquaticus TaxID=3163344 RepID=UPI00359612B0
MANTKNLFQLDYRKYMLDNGLQVILYKDNSLPIVSVNIWYNVGSANENPGKTGFAHLFEHMMFQGSQNVPKEWHFRYIQEAGGTLNGSTSLDRTNYYETLPSNYLELALWLESDRMGFLLPALTQEKLDNQKDVVMNERRQRYENQPYGLAWEKLFSNLYSSSHPYHWPTIGWMDDIAQFNLEDVKKFFRTYYAPNNASLVVGGDINYDTTISLVKKYFEEIPASNNIPKLNYQSETLEQTKEVIHKDNIQLPRIYFAWHTDKIFGNDEAALDILADILTGSKNGRLHKRLLFERQISQDVFAFQHSGKLGGSFIIASTAKPNISLTEIKEEIFNEINRIIQEGINSEELDRSKNSIKSSYIYSLQNLATIANQLNAYNFYLSEPNSFLYDIERIEKVTANNIINAVQKYFKKHFVELKVIPK